MDLYINVRGKNRNEKITADTDGTVSEETLRGAFRLGSDVPVTLYRRDIALKRLRKEDTFVFELKDKWNRQDFVLKFDASRRSRSGTPASDVVMSSPPPPIISSPPPPSVATKVLNGCSDRVFRVHGEMTFSSTRIDSQQVDTTTGQIGTGVQYHENRILTAAHLQFVKGKEYDLWQNGKTTKAQCIYINKRFDFSILESNSLPKTGFETGSFALGEEFITLGYPEASCHQSSSVSVGTIEGIDEDQIHFIGSIGSRHGYSGAPVFNSACRLNGIVIGGRNGVSLDMTTGFFAKKIVTDMGTQPNVRILPLSVIVAQATGESDHDSL